MNWVAKLVKNVEELVSGCRIYDAGSPQKMGFDDPKLCKYAHREDSDDNFLYCPTSEELKSDGVGKFRKHWARGEPLIVKQVFDSSFSSSWDPVVIWRGVRETADEKMKDENRLVKATDCLDWSEVAYCYCLYFLLKAFVFSRISVDLLQYLMLDEVVIC